MKDYNKGKIYKIYSLNDPSKIYIGSTIQPLRKRLFQHKSKYKKYNEGHYYFMSSFLVLKLGKVKIELIESYSCACRRELEKREGEIIQQQDCVNKTIPTGLQTRKEYDKYYRIKNKSKVDEKHRNWREKNNDYLQNYRKEYYQNKKQDIKVRKQKIYTCVCGRKLKWCVKARHERSKIHIDFVKLNPDQLVSVVVS